MSNFRQRGRCLWPIAVLLGTLGAGPAAAEIETPLRMHVNPQMARAPADLYIYVSVARREQNRMLRVTAESQDFYRSSEAQLDGEYSPRVTVFRFRELPSGEYRIKAELIVMAGRTANVETRAVQVF